MNCGYKSRYTQHLILHNILYEKHPLMHNPLSKDSRTKKQPASAAVSRASETYPAGSCPSSGAENTVGGDLVRRGREIERRVLALGALGGVADLEDRRPVEGNCSVISG